MAKDARFDSAVDRASLSLRVLQFLISNVATSLREVSKGVGDNSMVT